MSFNTKQVIIIGGAIGAVLLAFFLIVIGLRPRESAVKTEIVVWGVDNDGDFRKVTDEYEKLRPSIRVLYSEIAPEKYEEALLSALAGGRGPDVLYLGNHSISRFVEILSPVPESIFTLGRLRELYPKAVEQDLVLEGNIYALPLYLDTLALIYNKDFFDRAGIVSPPKTWDEFRNVIPYLRILTEKNQLTRSAAAIGGSAKTMENAPDLVQLFLMQKTENMIDPQSKIPVFAGKNGVAAFGEYLDFADGSSANYTWFNSGKKDGDAFTAGEAAVVFGYNEWISTLQRKNPFLDIGVALSPQSDIENPIAFPKYLAMGVARQSRNSAWAWDFIVNTAANENVSKIYMQAFRRPPAIRKLIGEAVNSAEFGVFARQALVARSWTQPDDVKVKDIFNSAVEKALSGFADRQSALEEAADKVGQLMNR